MQNEPSQSTSENRTEVEARAERQNDYRAHVFTCPVCSENEEALCPEGHQLLVAALK